MGNVLNVSDYFLSLHYTSTLTVITGPHTWATVQSQHSKNSAVPNSCPSPIFGTLYTMLHSTHTLHSAALPTVSRTTNRIEAHRAWLVGGKRAYRCPQLRDY